MVIWIIQSWTDDGKTKLIDTDLDHINTMELEELVDTIFKQYGAKLFGEYDYLPAGESNNRIQIFLPVVIPKKLLH